MASKKLSVRTSRALFFQSLFAYVIVLFFSCIPAFGQAFEASGTWSSTWGPVNLMYGGVNRDGTQSVTGDWKETSGKRGIITHGGFNRGNGDLWFEYYQPWDGVKGNAKFLLKNDGTMLDGTFHQTNGSGHWTLTRPLQNSVAQTYDDGGRGERRRGPHRGGAGGRARGDRDGDGIPNKYDRQDSSSPGRNNYGGGTGFGGAAATRTDINGNWSSNFGPVNLQCDAGRPDGTMRVSGSWNQGPGKIGSIQKGRYNPQDGSLWIKYFMPWKNLTGEANLHLKSRGQVLEGNWQQIDGSGSWRMTR